MKGVPFEVSFGNVGFFPTPKSPRVFWAGVQAGDQLPALAAQIDQRMEDLGIQPEIPLHAWRLFVDGDVENPVALKWGAFTNLSKVTLTTDIH